ncbi:MAG TPA: acyl-CoA desaturase [Kofleriaceae bacterium]|jgi:linoleoyl-CoA desaturase|nr:acyl-CoA desaturase [Kofleriaceae bacterium]
MITDTDIEAFGRELDAIQHEVKSSLGAGDRRYIKRAIAVQRGMALGGRALIFASLPLAPAFPLFLGVIGLGTASLGISKILENMEIGHNVLHGQWDWMQDPEIHSSTWEWDTACPADQWKHSHNVVHHTWTNVMGRDRDVGYEILRVTDKQPWKPVHLAQPIYNALLAVMFQWGVAMHDIDLGALRRGELQMSRVRGQLAGIGRKAGKQLLKDYVLWPALAGPWFLPVVLANLTANLMRNLWTYAIIFCGHFPDGVQVFTEADLEGETRGRWYLRQVLGSCNITGGPLFHVMSGNLSHQIEHHLFPDMPSNRYPEVAPRVEAVCAKYGVPYNKGSFARQLGTTMRTIFRLAMPTRRRVLAA